MKKIFVLVFAFTAMMLVAEGQSEISDSTAAFVDEITSTISDAKGIIGEYAPVTVEGLVARKVAYYDVIFPALPIMVIVCFALLILLACLCRWDDTDFDGPIGFIIAVFGIFFLAFSIWSLVDFVQMKQFLAAPEVTVIRDLLKQ